MMIYLWKKPYIKILILTTIIISISYFSKHIFVNNINSQSLRLDRIIFPQSKTNSNSLKINEIFQDFLNQSSEQLLVDEVVLMRTILFMIEERNEYDPELIDFVRSLIVQPPVVKGQVNLTDKKRTDFSQIGQSKYIDNLLGSKENGFFIESGGYNGEDHSNSVFFELERKWTGILIEPLPSFYRQILARNRNIYVLNACIASKFPIVAKFRLGGALSVRLAVMSKDHGKRIDKETETRPEFVYVPCFSLNTILTALRVKQVDYFSLDVEGGEWSVLSSLDYKNFSFNSFSIEYNGNQNPKKLIKNYLIDMGYKFMKEDGQDIYFLKN